MIIDPNVNPEHSQAMLSTMNILWDQLKKVKRLSGNVRDKAASNFGRQEALLLDGPIGVKARYIEAAQANVALVDEMRKYLQELYDFEKSFLTWYSKTHGEVEATNLLIELKKLKGN
jgi:hypothetical protein